MKNGHTHSSTCPICFKSIFLPILNEEPDRTVPFVQPQAHEFSKPLYLDDVMPPTGRTPAARTTRHHV